MFSRTGLILQLEAEGIATADAVFAVDTLDPDWDEHATAKAETYRRLVGFPSAALLSQLLFDGFTAEQAEKATR